MKTNAKTQKLTFLIALFVMILGLQIGVSQSDASTKYSVAYTQTTSKSYEINQADISKLYDFEKIGMKPINEVRNVSMTVNQNNDLTTIINIVSTNANESWMTPPSKIVIDKYGAKLYTAQNVLLTQDAYTPEQNQDYLSIKNDIAQNGWRALPQFQQLTQANITALQQQGFTVQNLAGGIVQVRKGATEVKYNNANLSYELTRYNGAKVESQSNFKFNTVGGKTVPAYKTERNYGTTESGVCYAEVTHTVYSNYQPIGLP